MTPTNHGGWRLSGVKIGKDGARFRITKPTTLGGQYRYGIFARGRGKYRLPVNSDLETVLTIGEQSYRNYATWRSRGRPVKQQVKSFFLGDSDIENPDPCAGAPGAIP